VEQLEGLNAEQLQREGPTEARHRDYDMRVA
jgi:hypothetical protein